MIGHVLLHRYVINVYVNHPVRGTGSSPLTDSWSIKTYGLLHRVPNLATPLQISWCKTVNTWQIFTIWIRWHRSSTSLTFTLYTCSIILDARIHKVDELRQRIQTAYGMNLISMLLTGRSSSGAPPKSLRRGQRWPLWVQTLKT